MEQNQAPLTKSNDPLGLNKISKNIKKSPLLQQPNFPPSQQPQPHVYNVNKTDFRSIVQQLTSSPLREPLPRPPQNNPKPPNDRLQRVRPPPLAHTSRPHPPLHPQRPVPSQPQPFNNVQYSNYMVRPPFDPQLLSPNLVFPPTPNDVYSKSNESPVSAYMRYLQSSVMDSNSQQGRQLRPSRPLVQAQPYYPLTQPQLVPNHVSQQISDPMVNAPPALMPPSPRLRGPTQVINLVSPGPNIPPPLLQSPSSQFLLPSPGGFFGLLSPRSPYPLLSPGYQNLPPPISPSFMFSPIGQAGILGPPPSPGFGFPLSPSGFFPLSSPRWRS